LDLGRLEATLGVNTDPLRTAEQQMLQFGRSAESTFGTAQGHVTAFGGQLMALVGISLSVAAALSVVKSNIEAISTTALGAIGTAATMLSKANIEGIEDQRVAYAQYKAYVLQMYNELNAETERHFASGKEMIGVFEAFAKKGIYAAQDQANAIGVISDAIKLLHRGQTNEATAMHEIQGLLEGHAGIRFKLAQQLKGMLGETWKETVQEHVKAGTLLTFLQEKYVGLSVATGDIQKVLTAQVTTLDTLKAQIGKGGLAGLYSDVVETVIEINSYLREHKDSLIRGIAEGWATIKLNIQGAVSAFSDSTIGEYTKSVVQAAIETGKWVISNGELVKSMVEFYIIAKAITWIEGLYIAITSAAAASVIFQGVTKGLIPVLFGAATTTTIYSSSMAVAATSMTSATAAGAALNLMMLTLLPSITAVILALAAYAAYKTFKEPGQLTGPTSSGDPFADIAGGTRQKDLPIVPRKLTSPDISERVRQAGLRATKTGEYALSTGEVITVPDWATQSTPKPPPWSPMLSSKKGGGKGEEAEINRLNSLFDTLTKSIASLSEGKLATIRANYDKTIEQIYKKSSDRAHTEAELAVLAKTQETLQETKLEEDYNLFIAKNSGDTYAELAANKKKWLTDYKGMKDVEKNVDDITARQKIEKDVDLYTKKTNYHKTYLDAMASDAILIQDQLVYQKQSLELENKLALAAIEKAVAQDKNLIGLKDQMIAEQALMNQIKKNALERKAWQSQGFSGGLQIGLMDARKTAETWQADQVASFLKSAPQVISQQMASSFIGALQGKKMDFQALSYQMAEWMIQKQMEGFLVQLMPLMIEGLMWLLGVEYTGKALAAQNAALIGLTAAEQEAVLKVRAAEEAASISKGGGSGGGWLSSIIGGIGSIVSGLFGNGPMNLSLGDLSSGAGGYSAYNVSPSGGYNYIPGSAARPMAEGAIVSSPTYALIGEGREPEIVAPLSKLFDYGGRSGPPQVNITINNNTPNSEAKAEQGPAGDIIVTIDQMTAQAYGRRGSLYKAINSGGGATKR